MLARCALPRAHLTPLLAAQRPVGHSLLAAVNQPSIQPRQKVWPHGSVTGWKASSEACNAERRVRTRLSSGLAAEGLIAERAGQVGGERRHPLAVAGLGAERSRAPLASLRSHGTLSA